LGEVDLAVLTFTSSGSYEIARLGDVKSVSSGSSIYVSGFPLASSAVPSRIARFLKGDVIANATVAIANGYQLLYSNPTQPGMSGGAVLNAQGQLIGIHGQGETDSQMSEQQGVAVKTGTNQAVPIAYYQQYASGESVVAASTQAATADDYLRQAWDLLRKKGREQEVITLANQALAMSQSAMAYRYRALAKDDLGDKRGAIADYDQAIAIDPKEAVVYYSRGVVKSDLGDKQGAIADYDQAIAIDPKYAAVYNDRGIAKADFGDKRGAISDYDQAIAIDPKDAIVYYNRGNAKFDLGDKRGAIADYDQAIAIDPKAAFAYNNRGNAKFDLGDKRGAIADYDQAIAIDPRYAFAYNNRGLAKSDLGDEQGACRDYKKAVSLGHRSTAQWLVSDDGAWCRNMP
jgi:tetratricopeptide (TPR) repeat protein